MRHPGIVSQSLDAFGGDFRRRAVRRYPVLARNKPTVTATATIASKASTVGRAATRYNSLVRINVPFNLAPSSRTWYQSADAHEEPSVQSLG